MYAPPCKLIPVMPRGITSSGGSILTWEISSRPAPISGVRWTCNPKTHATAAFWPSPSISWERQKRPQHRPRRLAGSPRTTPESAAKASGNLSCALSPVLGGEGARKAHQPEPSPLPCTRGRGAGVRGSGYAHKPPHPRPLSPEYGGEGRHFPAARLKEKVGANQSSFEVKSASRVAGRCKVLDRNGQRWKITIGLVLLLGTLALYWPATNYGFVNFDDPYYAGNRHVQAGLRATASAGLLPLWMFPTGTP